MKKILYNYRIIAQKLAMLKLGVRTINAEFIQTCIIPTFFCPVQTLCNLVPEIYSLFDVIVKE